MAGADVKTQKKILGAVALKMSDGSLIGSPPEVGLVIRDIVKKLVDGPDDPYKKIKQKSTSLALGIYSSLKENVAGAKDRLLVAAELAIAGNIIDYGAKNSLNIEEEIARIVKKEYAVIKHENKALFNYEKFKRDLDSARVILYLADNAGETVFDRILIEEIKHHDKSKKILYAVKEKPVINDALIDDAIASGIGASAEIFSSGSQIAGNVLKYCNSGFKKIFKNADMIISKGQGNFETLSCSKRSIFFLFMVKCDVIARHVCLLGAKCKVGDIALLYKKGKNK